MKKNEIKGWRIGLRIFGGQSVFFYSQIINKNKYYVAWNEREREKRWEIFVYKNLFAMSTFAHYLINLFEHWKSMD